MLDEETPRDLPERTGRHRCIRCLADAPGDVYFANDHLCDACAREGDSEQERNEP